jgi:hypothetical protein
MTFVPLILVVGCSEAFLGRVRTLASGFPALVRATELASIANAAAELRPFAFVMPEDIFAFDERSFQELARDVGASLVGIPDEEVELTSLEALLRKALASAEAKRT